MKKNLFVTIFGPIGFFPKTYRYYKIYNSLLDIEEKIFSGMNIIQKGACLLNKYAISADIRVYKKFCRQLRRLVSSYYDKGKITEEQYIEIMYQYKKTRENLNLYARYIEQITEENLNES